MTFQRPEKKEQRCQQKKAPAGKNRQEEKQLKKNGPFLTDQTLLSNGKVLLFALGRINLSISIVAASQ
jgi:hypothetical protein